MRVIVCGSRGWDHPDQVARRVARLPVTTTLIHGAARGPDTWAARAARERGLDVVAFPAEWERLGKRAGFVRNQQMLDHGARFVIAFWDGESVGTMMMLKLAQEIGVPTETRMPGGVVFYDTPAGCWMGGAPPTAIDRQLAVAA